MKILKKLLKIMVLLLLFVVIVIGGYVGYVSIQYHRLNDNLNLTDQIINENENQVLHNTSYSIGTYNIGFGAYCPEFSFFMDSGVMNDGTVVTGKNSTAFDKETVLTNTNGSINGIKNLDLDFVFLQEVDVEATRSHKVNQYELFQTALIDYESVMAINFDSAYLLYPLNDPHGKTLAGITTFSKYHATEVVRRSFPVDDGFPTKFFDLDRCFMVNRYPVGDKQLVLINVHMSAYDEGGLIRAQQLTMLNEVLKTEYESGNYVIVGGDFNHDITNETLTFASDQQVPEWVQILSDDQLTAGYSFKYGTNAPTIRSTDIPYTKGVNFTATLDGFIVSDNVIVEFIEVLDLDFAYSDHNPVYMTFKLL